MQAADNPYALLIAVGNSPQVITETVYCLARQVNPPLLPAQVEAVTTAAGENATRALLEGEGGRIDFRTGRPYPDAEDRWTPFCCDMLGLDAPVPITYHVPRVHGRPLEDVLSILDDEQFGDTCYRVVADLTGKGQPPVIGSIAGGRKTMSAHLMTAFSVYARPEDRLCHVLLWPEEPALMRSFYYPTDETPEYARLHLVDVLFPRMQEALAQAEQLSVPKREEGLRGWLSALAPLARVSQDPATYALVLRHNDPRVRVEARDAGGGVLAECTLPATPAVTLIVIGYEVETADDEAPRGLALVGGLSGRPTHRMRQRVMRRLNGTSEVKEMARWKSNDGVSSARSELEAKLKGSPLLHAKLTFESEGKNTSAFSYRWAEPLTAPLVVEEEGKEPVGLVAWVESVMAGDAGSGLG